MTNPLGKTVTGDSEFSPTRTAPGLGSALTRRGSLVP